MSGRTADPHRETSIEWRGLEVRARFDVFDGGPQDPGACDLAWAVWRVYDALLIEEELVDEPYASAGEMFQADLPLIESALLDSLEL